MPSAFLLEERPWGFWKNRNCSERWRWLPAGKLSRGLGGAEEGHMRAPSRGDNITFIRGQQALASRKPTRIRLGCSEIWGWGKGD